MSIDAPAIDARATDDASNGCSAVEDCFNGLDDDCNGRIDCDDPACTGGASPVAECVPDPGSAMAGTVADTTCPSGYPTATQIFSGLTPGGCAAGTCTCNPPASQPSPSCNAVMEEHGTQMLSCVTVGTRVFNTSSFSGCFSIAAMDPTKYYSFSAPTVSAPCGSPTGGTAAKTAPTWATTQTFCGGAAVGGGCAQGQVCMPKAARHCVLEAGDQVACTVPGYTVQDPTQYFSGYDDSARTCACACPATGTCAGYLLGTNMCNNVLGNTGACIHNVSYNSVQILSPTNVACTPSGTSSGSTSTSGFERTLCCTN